MYTQKDINEFAYFITLYVFDKAYKKYHGPCDITDSMINDSFEENSLLIAVCNNGSYESYTGFFGKTRIGYMIDSIHKEDKNTFYKTINDVYDINVLFQIGIPMIKDTINDLPIPQEVLDDIFSYSAEVEAVITPQQLEYVESLEWDCDYWDSLPIEVIDSLDPEVRELCFEYYGSMLVPEASESIDVEPVRDDVKLLLPVIEPLPVEVEPQEVVEEPQEELSLSTTTNEDKTMSIILPDFSTNGNTFQLVPVEFTSIWYEVPTVELTGQASDFACHISDGWTGQSSDVLEGWTGQYTELTCDVLNGQSSDVLEGWTGQCSELTCHISDGWYGQCCDLADATKPVQLEPEQLSEAQYRVQQACAKMARRSAYASPVRCGSPVVNTPTITTKSGDIVKVSDEQFAELEKMFDKAMAKPKFPFTIVNNNSLQGNQINPDCSRNKAIIGYGQVSEFKSTLFNVDEYDITRNVVVDVATTTPKSTPATPKATVTPKTPVSTAKFANNFNSLVMAKYRELNGGIIKDSLVLNKLTSALRANNSEAYTALVTTFGNPTAVALHRQAYDTVVSAS